MCISEAHTSSNTLEPSQSEGGWEVPSAGLVFGLCMCATKQREGKETGTPGLGWSGLTLLFFPICGSSHLH